MSQSARNLFLLDVLGYLNSSVTYPYYRSFGSSASLAPPLNAPVCCKGILDFKK